MIRFQEVSYTYLSQGSEEVQSPSLNHISFHIPKGQCVVLCGKSGCGKTTLLRIINGLACHFYQGRLEGDVLVSGMAPASASLPELARVVGSVFQNPRTQFFHTDTTGELAFQLENQNMPREQMRRRLDRVVTELGLEALMDRSIFALSGGEKQQIACGSVYASLPQVVVLDEPSSNLDGEGIRQLREILKQLKAAEKTVLVAEHRLWYAADLADRVLYLREGRLVQVYPGSEFLNLPEEKRQVMGLRSLTEVPLPEPRPASDEAGEDGLSVRGLRASYDRTAVWDQVSFSAPRGQITAITGHNGAGKTTLARCLCGLMKEQAGTILWDESPLGRKERRRKAFLIMQDVNLQLFGDSVLTEARLGSTATEREALAALERMDLAQYAQAHPLALSGGQKQRLAIVDGCLSGKELLIFDEPTSGLDYAHMLEVSRLLRELAKQGLCVVVITHDGEFLRESGARAVSWLPAE